MKGADGDEDSYIVELSYESKTVSDAAAAKAAITEALDKEGILLHEDSLKTQRILDAWIPRKEKPGITARFFAMEGDAEPIYQAEDLKAGDTVKPPADPFREGYRFKGWLLCRGRRRMGWQAGGKIIRHMHPSRPGNRMTGCKYGLFYREPG